MNWLRVFEAAARTGSFVRASELLNMSSPAVSQQIRALEGALGRKLFERGPRSVVLTDAGKAFLPTVASALHSVESATANLFGWPQNASLTVQCSLMLAAGWLAPRLPRFSAAYPEIRLNLASVIHDEEFDANKADLRIAFAMPPKPFEKGEPLFGEKIYPVAKPEIAAELRCPADLAKFPLVEIATHRANWWSFLPAEGPKPRFIYADNTLTALALARSGAIALAREPASGDLPAIHGLVHCAAFSPLPGVQGYTLISAGPANLSPAAAQFREWLLAEAAAMRNG